MDVEHSLLFVLVCIGEGFGDVLQLDDLGPVSACGLEVVARRAAMRENHSPTSKHTTCIRDCLSMIAAADGHNSGVPRVFQITKNLVECSAYLEGASRLK